MNEGARSNRRGGGPDLPSRRSPYAVLNLTQRSRRNQPISDDEIRDSYKRLSRLFHPDKHPPGKEKENAQEIFIELHHAYEVLLDPALRQAYDHFGHSGMAHLRHNRYGPDSLYRKLIALHDDGRSSDAFELLQIVLENSRQKQRQQEWQYSADVAINVNACIPEDAPDCMKSPEVTSTNVSLTALVPTPPQTVASPFQAQSSNANTQPGTAQREQKIQFIIGGQSNLENGMGSTRAILSANYQPVDQMSLMSDLTIGHKHLETSLSSSAQLSNGTSLSAKMTRRYELGSGKEGMLALGFSSDRTLTLFQGRTVLATFALGLGADFQMHYGLLKFTTWGFSANEAEEEHARSQITAKMTMGTQYPIEFNIVQPNLFNSRCGSGRVTVAWSPLQGYKLRGMISRKVSKRWHLSESEFASYLAIGVEHTGFSGLKWIIRYKHPDGLSVQIPILMSSILSPVYWDRVVWVSTLSYVLDKMIEEWLGHPSSEFVYNNSDASHVHKILAKIHTNRKERKWTNSSKANENAKKQLTIMAPIAILKRQREESINGLVILKATYASVSHLSLDLCSSKSIEVTQQLQFWVQNSRLYLPPSSKSMLLGFYDLLDSKVNTGENTGETISAISNFTRKWICIMNCWLLRRRIRRDDAYDGSHYKQKSNNRSDSESVMLTVRYKYKDQVFETRVGDDDELDLPNRNATVLGSSIFLS